MHSLSKTVFESPESEIFFRERFALSSSKAKGKAPQTSSSQPKKPKPTSLLSSSSNSVESIQAKPPPKPNPYIAKYFQDFQDPCQLMISNGIIDFLSQARQNPTIALASEKAEQQASIEEVSSKEASEKLSEEQSNSKEESSKSTKSGIPILMVDPIKEASSVTAQNPDPSTR